MKNVSLSVQFSDELTKSSIALHYDESTKKCALRHSITHSLSRALTQVKTGICHLAFLFSVKKNWLPLVGWNILETGWSHKTKQYVPVNTADILWPVKTNIISVLEPNFIHCEK